MRKTIVIGYDGGAAADRAVAIGAELSSVADAKLLLVFASNGDSEEQSWDVLRRGMNKLPYGVPAKERAVPHRAPADALRESAEDEQALMVILGAAGAVSGHLIENAPCPVLVARAPAG
jgi:nucleotide-binding universal stress UspA family protein